MLRDVGTGQLALAKLGGDTPTLAGTNTYSGQTAVEDGTLNVTGSISDSPVDLAGGEIQGSDGNGTVTVETTVVLGSSDNDIVYGNSATFTATVSPVNSAYAAYGTPTGSVDFYDESTGTDLGTGTYANGVYTLQVSGLDVEDHYIAATYSGDSVFVSSTSDPLDQEVDAATSSTSVSVTDSEPAVTGQITYGDSLTLTATISASYGTPTGSVEFYDGSADLGPADLTANTDGTSSATWTTTDLSLGSHTITAVYSGDNNFSGSQSDASQPNVDVVGQSLSLSTLTVGGALNGDGQLADGSDARVSGTVYGLDGAAFTVAVRWGDGQSEQFYFAAGATSFNVSHYYLMDASAGTVVVPSPPSNLVPYNSAATETYTILVTVRSSDGRSVTPATNPTSSPTPDPTVTLVDPGPTVTMTGLPEDANEACTLAVAPYEPWDPGATSADFSYQWCAGDWSTSASCDFAASTDNYWASLYAATVMGGLVTVTDGFGAATTVSVNQWPGLPAAQPTQPTATITETDANGAGLVFRNSRNSGDTILIFARWEGFDKFLAW